MTVFFILILVFVTLLIFTKICSLFYSEYKVLTCIVILCLWSFWWKYTDGSVVKVTPRHEVIAKMLVSAAPSNTKLSGSFYLGSGSIESARYYLLREKISENYYKDFEVHKEVFIKEDRTLTKGVGMFLQHFNCSTIVQDFTFVRKLYHDEEEVCSYEKQEIVLPEGFVIKNLSI